MPSQTQLQQHLHWLIFNWKCFNLHDQSVVYKHCKLMSKVSWLNKFETEKLSSLLLLYGYNTTHLAAPISLWNESAHKRTDKSYLFVCLL